MAKRLSRDTRMLTSFPTSGVTQIRPYRVTSKPAMDKPLNQDVNSGVRAITLRRCEQRLERANETTSHRAGAAGMVAASHSEDHGRPPGNGGRLLERGWGRGTGARLMGTRLGTGQRSRYRASSKA